MESALRIELPPWLAGIAAGAVVLPAVDGRMAYVAELARRNAAAGGGPFAAAVFELASGRLVAAGGNLVVMSRCSSAHAEVVALSLAQQRLANFDLAASGLPDHQLISSAEPCAMCVGAVLWSGVKSLVYGAREEDVRAIGFDEGPKHPHWADALRASGIQVTADVRRRECATVLRDYAAAGGPIYNARNLRHRSKPRV
ncbi:MAG TPA: nucleoside deaminase [Rhodocyclaceae bacterium]|nr:nucleoside deaminase [Rhodocyclaceae bacterium]